MACNGWELVQLPDRSKWSIKDLRALLEQSPQYSAPKSATRPILLERIARMERGRPSYQSYTIKEMLGAIASRGLPKVEGRLRKKGLAAVLERADDDRTFTRFEELPAELRTYVYEFHIADLPKTSIFERPPPITNINRLVRKEFFPLFYGAQTLHVNFDLDGLSHQARTLLRHGPLSVLGSISSFMVSKSLGEGAAVVLWTVRPSKDKGRPCRVIEGHYRLDVHCSEQTIFQVNARMKRLVQRREKNGRFRFQRQDYDEFLDLVNSIMMDSYNYFLR